MRKLLQSKAAVSVLVVVATAAVLANFVSLPKLLGVAASARTTGEPGAPADEALIKMPPNSRLAAEQLMWRELFPLGTSVRDPFAPPADSVSRTPLPNTIPTGLPNLPVFVLQAISHEPGRAYAIVNQQVLAEGEQVSGYTVERIHPRSVDLRGHIGLVSLTLPQTAARQKPPIGKPAPADLPAADQRITLPATPR